MNQTAAAMGLTATHYDNPNGLPDPGQLTSARDLAILAMHIHIDYPAYLPIFDTQRVRIGDHLLKSENDLLTKFQGTTGMKTGFICDSGLNIVATVERNGRRLMAVLLGGSSSRERNEKTAQMFLRALAGGYTDTGKNIMDLSNDLGKPVGDISSEICGRKARAFQAQERKDFPMGLKGQPSYLTDKIPPVIYEVSTANAVGPVPLPRPRPASDMAAADPGPAGGIPQPQPRTAAQR
jgi:D-alanyl-D-alanine carboxypeptidase